MRLIFDVQRSGANLIFDVQVVVTISARMRYTVEPDHRAFEVAPEDSTFTIAPDHRAYVVSADDRTYIIN